MKFLALLHQNLDCPFPFLLFQIRLWSCCSFCFINSFMLETSALMLSFKPHFFFFYPVSQKSLFFSLYLDMELESSSRICINQDKKTLIFFSGLYSAFCIRNVFLTFLKVRKGFLRYLYHRTASPTSLRWMSEPWNDPSISLTFLLFTCPVKLTWSLLHINFLPFHFCHVLMTVHLHQRCHQGQKGPSPISRPSPQGRKGGL